MTHETKTEARERYIVKFDEEAGDRWMLVDTETGEVVGCDGGEPEDQLLLRDWKWVPALLNRQDAALAASEEKAREMREAGLALYKAADDAIYVHTREHMCACAACSEVGRLFRALSPSAGPASAEPR